MSSVHRVAAHLGCREEALGDHAVQTLQGEEDELVGGDVGRVLALVLAEVGKEMLLERVVLGIVDLARSERW